MTSSWHGRVSAQEGRSPLHGIANSGRHRNGCYGADFNYPQGENSLSFFQTVEVGLVFIRGSAFCVYSWFYFVGFQNLNFISVHTASIPSDHLIFFPSSMERGL